MADVLLVTIKLKEQGEGCQFHIGVFDEDTFRIQFLLQHFGSEGLRDHRQFQITVIAHVVVDDVVGHPIGIEVLRLTVGIQGDGNGTGHRGRHSIGHRPVLCDGEQGVVRILKVEFHLIVLFRHS